MQPAGRVLKLLVCYAVTDLTQYFDVTYKPCRLRRASSGGHVSATQETSATREQKKPCSYIGT
jgi:hypothetical protein